MKILKQESPTSRIVQKWSLNALGFIIARQRKKGLFWRRTAWLYTRQCGTVDQFASHFDYQEQKEQIGTSIQF